MTVTLYIIIGIITALVLMGVVTYLFLEDVDYDPEGEELGMLAIGYLVCLVCGAGWPVVIALALIAGFFYGFYRIMRMLLKALKRSRSTN